MRGSRRYRDPAIAASQALRRVAGDQSRARPSGRAPSAPEVVAALIKLLGDPAAGRRLSAVYSLTSFEADDAVVGAFIGASRDRDESVRVAALQALQGRGARLRSRSLETIRAAMEDPAARVRYAAAYALIDFGIGVEPMVPALIRHAEHDPDLTVRDTVARALGSLGPPAVSPAVVPMYLEAIESPGASATLRENLVGVLADFGPAARVAVPAIVRCSGRPRARMSGGRRLPTARCRPSDHRRPRSSRDERVAVRRNAALALGVLAPGTPTGRRGRRRPDRGPGRPGRRGESAGGRVAGRVRAGGAGVGARPAPRHAPGRAEQGPPAPAGWRRPSAGSTPPRPVPSRRSTSWTGCCAPTTRCRVSSPSASWRRSARPRRRPSRSWWRWPVGRPSGRVRNCSRSPRPSAWIAPGTAGADQALGALLELLQADPEPPGIEAVIDATSRFGAGAAAALPRLRELARSGEPPVAEAARKAVEPPGGRRLTGMRPRDKGGKLALVGSAGVAVATRLQPSS